MVSKRFRVSRGGKRLYGSKGMKRDRPTASVLKKEVLNVKKSVKEIRSKEELKFKDTFLNGTALNTTATLTLLNGLSLGDTVNSREADEITATSIQFRNTYAMVATNTNSDILVRHIIFWDMQANGSAPSAGDVLDQAVITLATIAPYKREYQKRFKILHDKVIRVAPNMADPTLANTEVLSPRVYERAKRSLSRTVKYRNAQNTGVITDIGTNSLYSMLVTDNGTANITVQAGYRFYFKDD